MEKTKPQFHNTTFFQAFTKKANFKLGSMIDNVHALKELLDYVILEYKFNKDGGMAYILLHKFEIIKSHIISKYDVTKLNNKERKALTELIHEFKTNPFVAIIREKGLSQPFQHPFSNNNISLLKTPLKPNQIQQENENSMQEQLPQNDEKITDDHITTTFEEMKKEFEEHKIENAYEHKQELQRLSQSNSLEEQSKQYLQSLFDQNTKLIKEIDVWHTEIQKVLKELNTTDGYIDDTSSKLYASSYKTLSEGKAILKMEGPLKMPLFNILALMYEAEGFNHWVPFCSDAKLIKHLHKASHVYWMKYGLPFPLTDRECHCFGYGADRFERNGSILLISRSIDFDNKFLEHYDIQIPKQTNLIKMDIEVATEFVPINKNEMIMRQITTVDPKVENTPPFIMTWISRKIGQHMFETLLKKAQNLKGTMWEQGIKKKPEFYSWLDKKVNAFLQEHQLA